MFTTFQFEPRNDWGDFTETEQDHKLQSLGLLLDRTDRVILCTLCKYALKPGSRTVSKHLGESHHVPASARKGLDAFIQSLRLLDPEQLRPRADGGVPHPHLAIHTGCACSVCKYKTTSLELMGRHVSKMHDPGKKGKKWIRDLIRTGLNLQSWTQNGSGQGFWIVASNEQATVVPAWNCSPGRIRTLDALHRQERERIARDDGAHSATDVEDKDLALISNWMRRTRWAETYKGLDRKVLWGLTVPPSSMGQRLIIGHDGAAEVVSSAEDERKLGIIGRAVSRFLNRCEQTARHTDHSIRCWLRSQIPGQPNKAAFQLPSRQATIQRYNLLWTRLIIFCVRLYRLEQTAGRSLGISLSVEQRRIISSIWLSPSLDKLSSHSDSSQGLGACSSRSREGELLGAGNTKPQPCRESSNVASASDYSSDEEAESRWESDSEFSCEDQATVEKERSSNDTTDDGTVGLLVHSWNVETDPVAEHDDEEELADLTGSLSKFLCTEEFVDGRSSSTIIVFYSGILGFTSARLGFERARTYTSKLSALIYCIRLCLLEATLPRFAHSSIGWAIRPRIRGLDKLNTVRERYMCNSCQAPMGELLSLRAYGRVLSRSDGPSFRSWWSEDAETISWDEGQLTMRKFRELGRSATESVKASLHRLMYGLEPGLNIAKLRDRFSDNTRDYSFVQDATNGLSTAYLQLSSRACLDPMDGLMRGSRWNVHAVHRYLKEEAKCLTLLMLVMYLRGGQAPRASELFSIECINGSSTSRGIYVDAGLITYVIRHSKARHATNQEFQVARYLDHQDSELLATYLIYVRPFVELIRRDYYGFENKRRLLFAAYDNPDKAWKVEILRKALRELTERVCGIAFGVQIYRQISIAVTEKHIKQIRKPFNRYDDKSVDADINVAFAWQSGHRPMQRGVNYGVDAAYPDSLQPALLNVYRWTSQEWQRFLDPSSAHVVNVGNNMLLRTNGNEQYSHKRALSNHYDNAIQTRKRHHPKLMSSIRTIEYVSDGLGSKERQNKQRALPWNPSPSSPTSSRDGSLVRVTEPPRSQLSLSNAAFVPSHQVGAVVNRSRATLNEDLRTQPTIPDPFWIGGVPLFGQLVPLQSEKAHQEHDDIIANWIKVQKESIDRRPFANTDRDFTRWKNVGCQLCYVNTGRPEPDHHLLECKADGHEATWRNIAWLAQLRLPRYYDVVGNCSLCSELFYPCAEMCKANQIDSAVDTNQREFLTAGRDMNSGLDGLCEMKPVVRNTIAALCAYDGQFLGRVLAKWLSSQSSIDFSVESQVTRWFEERVPCGRHKRRFPQILVLFDTLLRGFEFRMVHKHKSNEPNRHHTKCHQRAPELADFDHEPGLQEWAQSIKWWEGKCGFCAGRGLHDDQIAHMLAECKRGGAIPRRTGLGNAIYVEGLFVRGGCWRCCLPREMCRQWRKDGKKWLFDELRPCKYRQLVYDTVIGLYHSADPKFASQLFDDMQETGECEGLNDVEEIARWLGTSITVEGGVQCSRIMEQFQLWTEMVQHTVL